VLDVMMPGEDGLSVCRRLRSQDDIPILMLTALVGKLFEPFGRVSVAPLAFFGPQQAQLGPCDEARLGLSADRSFTACALTWPRSRAARRGGVIRTRGAGAPQCGQGHGSAKAAMGRSASKVPWLSQWNS
jgi:hypothetical protein